MEQVQEFSDRESDRAVDATCEDACPIRVKLISVSLPFLDGREMLDAFRHRYVLAHYLAFTVALLVLIYLMGLSAAPIGILYPAILTASLAAMMAGWAYLALMLLVLGPEDAARPLAIRLEPGIAAAALAVSGTVGWMQEVMGGGQHPGLGQSLGQLGLAMAWLTLSLVYLMRRTLPRSIRRLRRDREEAAARRAALATRAVALAEESVAEAADSAAAPDAPVPAPDAPVPAPAESGILAAVLRLEASGNYVTVVTERGRRTVPGPFAAVVARMPQEAGRQVHRSHWVARHAVIGNRRNGRDMQLLTVDGESVPVSGAKAGSVRAWLGQGAGDRGT